MLARTMINEGMPAAEVCEQLGYNHYSSFYREFMNIFHVPPSSSQKLSDFQTFYEDEKTAAAN